MMSAYAAPGVDSAEFWAKKIAKTSGVTIEQVKSDSRERPLPDVRKVISYLLREKCTLSEIGRAINRDHASVLTAKKKYYENMEANKSFRDYFEPIVKYYENEIKNIEMNNIDYPKVTGEVYVKYPVEVNNGWVAAEVHHEGYHIDLNGEIYVNEVDCHEACAAHNLQYWTREQVEVIISTSMKNSITMRDPLHTTTDVMCTLKSKGVSFDLDKVAQNTIENVFYETFKSLHKEASINNMSLAILRHRWNNVFEAITSHVAQSEREQVLIDELYGLMKP